MKRILSLVFLFQLLVCLTTVHGQRTIQKDGVQSNYKGVVYSEERALHLTIHTNGMYAGVDWGKIRRYDKTRYYHLALGYIQHRLEKSQNKNVSITQYGSSSSFCYGKQHSLYLIRGGVGVKRYYSEQVKRKGVVIGWSYMIGPVIGLLKPVENIYLIDQNGDGIKKPTLLTYKDDPTNFMNYSAIFGGSNRLNSWAKTTFRPAVHVRAAAHFSLGAYTSHVQALDVGVECNYFGYKIPIMVEQEGLKNTAIFLNLFASLQFGYRK